MGYLPHLPRIFATEGREPWDIYPISQESLPQRVGSHGIFTPSPKNLCHRGSGAMVYLLHPPRIFATEGREPWEPWDIYTIPQESFPQKVGSHGIFTPSPKNLCHRGSGAMGYLHHPPRIFATEGRKPWDIYPIPQESLPQRVGSHGIFTPSPKNFENHNAKYSKGKGWFQRLKKINKLLCFKEKDRYMSFKFKLFKLFLITLLFCLHCGTSLTS